MKNIRLFAVMAALTLISLSSFAQPDNHNWMDRIKSEKIAFITAELELTPQEAEAFWPIYNQIEKSKLESQKVVMASYKSLADALNSGTASDKEIDKLLDAYVAAKNAHKEAGNDEVAKYRKVLSGKKVAKLYIAEEKFRRHHIRSFKGNQPKR